MGFYGLLKRSGIKDLPSDSAQWRALADQWWRKLFHVKQPTASFLGRLCQWESSQRCAEEPKPIVEGSDEDIEPDLRRLSDFDKIWGS